MGGMSERSGTSKSRRSSETRGSGCGETLRVIIALHSGLQALSELRESLLEFAAEDGRDTKRSQIVRVHRRIQAITT